jgi:uncharacterized protein (TIGR02246 family)
MQNDEPAIRELFQTWHDATVKGDLSKLLTLMAEDVVFLLPGKPPMGKDLFAASFRGTSQQYRIDYTWNTEDLHVAGDFAYCRNHLDVTVTPQFTGSSVARRSGYTLTILRKTANGKWVIARDANLMTADSAK